MVTLAKFYAKSNMIDSLENLKDDNVFIFQSLLDQYNIWFNAVVIADFYRGVGVAKWMLDSSVLAKHGFVSIANSSMYMMSTYVDFFFLLADSRIRTFLPNVINSRTSNRTVHKTTSIVSAEL